MSRPTRFVLLVQEYGWTSYERFAIVFREAAQQAAEKEGNPRLATVLISRATFDRWMAGRIQGTPRREPAAVLRHLFNMSAERLFETVSEERAVRAQAGAVFAGIDMSAGQLQFDDPLQVIAQARSLTGSNADPAVLAMAEGTIQRVIDRYEVLGPQHLAGEVRVLRTMLHAVLGGHQPPRVRAKLFGLAARAAGLLAYMAVNAGAAWEVADAYCTEAETLAVEAETVAGGAGDVHLQMWVAGTRSLALYYSGRYSEADAAAEAGGALAPDSPQSIRLLVNGRARALARLGDRSGTDTAITQALALSDRQPALPEGLTSCIDFAPYSPARSLANALTARLSLNDVDAVLAYAQQIDELIENSASEWSRALVGLDVATALLQQHHPEVERAMALGRRALRAGTTAPIRSVWQRANELYAHARPWHAEPEVGDYAEELRTWRSQPQAAPIVVGAPALASW
ncbi:hypothetical protein [Streptomyces syringium]|uniref:hypothetical protein n=1 Tax=Streptomyces syringium TaxID=76729 RepID=UPI0033EB7DEA